MRLNSSRAGHDKLVRVVQYSCRLMAACQTNPAATRQLEQTVRSARKFLRLGTSLDALHASLMTVRHPDIIIRLTLTLSRIASAMFLFGDHVVWLASVGLLRTQSNQWSTFSNKSWLYSIILNLLRDLYEIRRVLHCYTLIAHREASLVRYVLREHTNAALDSLKNVTDLLLPLAALGYIKAPKLVGLCGIVSSLAAAVQIINPRLKL